MIVLPLNSIHFDSFLFHFDASVHRLHRDGTKLIPENLEPTLAPSAACAVCPWDEVGTDEIAAVSVSVCPWDEEEPPSTSKQAVAR